MIGDDEERLEPFASFSAYEGVPTILHAHEGQALRPVIGLILARRW